MTRASVAIVAFTACTAAAAQPAAPDETGKMNSVPSWLTHGPNPLRPGPQLDELFARYDTDGDGAISWSEAQQDADLVRVFERADVNRDGALTRGEFQEAAILARNERHSAVGG